MSDNVKENQNSVNDIKNGIQSFSKVLAQQPEPVAIQNPMFNYKMESQNNTSIENIVSSGAANINNTACEAELRNFYNISENISLILKKIEFNPRTNLSAPENTNASNAVNFAFYHPITYEPLNMSLCLNLPITISTPIKVARKSALNLYQRIPLAYGVDLFNIKSPAYNSRCFKGNNTNGADISMNYKRTQWFQNTSAECSPGCEYIGLDQNNYTQCNCEKVQENSEISNDFDMGSLSDIGKFNYDIVICYKEVFTEVIIFHFLNFIFRKLINFLN